jgi:hypothetical protein
MANPLKSKLEQHVASGAESVRGQGVSASNAYFTGAKEGREAAKDGKPRESPYNGIPSLGEFNRGWLDGWDAMRSVVRRSYGVRNE